MIKTKKQKRLYNGNLRVIWNRTNTVAHCEIFKTIKNDQYKP